jgi:hypothetical protein
MITGTIYQLYRTLRLHIGVFGLILRDFGAFLISEVN